MDSLAEKESSSLTVTLDPASPDAHAMLLDAALRKKDEAGAKQAIERAMQAGVLSAWW